MRTQFAGRFAEWEPLGEGGEGKLYRVRDRWTGRMAALKVADDAVGRDALAHEFRLLSTLRHPCLIESSDLVRDDAVLAHLLEYVPAVEPRSLWDLGGEEAVWAALIQALRGLTYLHRRGFVHGDVAPGNILVWGDGDRWRAKVVDLGLTLSAEEATASGVRGTPGFMAPETARGEGLLPASDLYALAATAVCWIDGRGPWEGASAAEQLKRVAAGDDVPRPKRRISPELENLLVSLGRAAPESRSPGDWSELREEDARWGPPTLRATVVGLDETMAEWRAWFAEVPSGQVASILVSGRVGTGKKTLCRSFARSLVAEGWTALWDLPLDSMRDWLEAVEGDPDPVQLARALADRFAEKDVVLLWPERVGEVESRLLQAFVTGREGEEGGVRTLVLGAGEGEDGGERSFLKSTGVLDWSWNGPMASSLGSVHDDLFSQAEIDGPSSLELSVMSTPMAIEALRLSQVTGRKVEELGAGTQAIEREVARVWGTITSEAREALSLLSWSDQAWSVNELSQAFDWNHETRDRVFEVLDRIHLTTREYRQDSSAHRMSDWITRDLLARKADTQLGAERIVTLGRRLEDMGLREGDLRLVQAFGARGVLLRINAKKSLNEALAGGRYGRALGIRSALKDLKEKDAGILRLFLRASQALGNYAEEAEILRELLAGSISQSEVVPLRKELSSTLMNLGDWRGALQEVEELQGEDLSERDRVWTLLQKAEVLWQAGKFSDADEVYERARPALKEGMEEEWLRFSVGRARQFGQRGDMESVDSYLQTAIKTVGKVRCEQDTFYLLTLGGLKVERSEQQDARPLLEKAGELARDECNWISFVMALSKSSSVAHGVGEVKEARKAEREGLVVAVALGSERITGRMYGHLGFSELRLGNVSKAYDLAMKYLRIATNLGDLNMEIQTHRLLCQIAAHTGRKGLVNSSAAQLVDLSSSIGEQEGITIANRCLGIFALGAEEWAAASDHLQAAILGMRRLKNLDSELETRILFLIGNHRSNSDRDAGNGLKAIERQIASGKALGLRPLVKLARFEVDDSSANERNAVAAIGELWTQQRILDIIEWVPWVVSYLQEEERVSARKKLLSAVERVANSLDDASLRKEFLSFKSTKRALQALKG